MARHHSLRTAFQRLWQLLRTSGVKKTVGVAVSVVEDRYINSFDRKYGVWTSGPFALSESAFPQDKLANATRYDPVNAWAFRWVLNQLALAHDLAFADFGCGLGRACIIAAEYGFRRVVGVELAADTCKIVRRNIAICRSRSPGVKAIQIVEGDVLDYCRQTEEDVFFMYRPFTFDFFCVVLGKLAERAAVQKKLLTIIYTERLSVDSYTHAFAEVPGFRLTFEGTRLGAVFYVYECGG
jgi:SAM-dependent methyltransferase